MRLTLVTSPMKFFSTLLAIAWLTGCKSPVEMPNIILILTDDQGYADISANGSPDVSTPSMDDLKSQGISLNDFQVSPTCSPTRSAIMTGRHPFKNGITHTLLERERMALHIATLPEVLKRANYTTGIFGKWHLGDEPEYQPDRRGFDEVFIHGSGGIGQAFPGSGADVPENRYFDPVFKHNGTFVKTKGFCTDVIFSQALGWIRKQSRNHTPFFAYIATNAAHDPFFAPDKYKEKFNRQGYPEDARGYYAMIENIDDNLGVLLDKLDAWDLAQSTIVIFMTDNGKSHAIHKAEHEATYNAGMRGFKGSPYEGGTRVPFFIRWPGKFKAGQQIEVLLNHYDILPTLADIVGMDISDLPDLDGQSFLPYLQGKEVEQPDRYRFVHGGRWPLNPNNTNGQIIDPKWLGTEESSNPQAWKYINCAVRNEQYRLVNNSELYDLYNDPGETRDVASEHPGQVVEMQLAYDRWWDSVLPYLVNENIPLAGEKPFWVQYSAQKEAQGIEEWSPPGLD